jgi:hypothetical protein
MTSGDKPIVVQSIVTEPNGTFLNDGNLAIAIQDRNNAGVSGIDVGTTSPDALTDTTDSNGCAFFGHLSAGAWQGGFSQPGYVDINGNNAITGSWTIVAGQTTLQTFKYDLAAAPTVNFQLGGTTTPTNGNYVTFTHPSRSNPLVVGNGTATLSLQGSNLFPFTTAYAVYAGKNTCTGNSTVATNVILPTATPVVVNEPPINILIQKAGASASDFATNAFVKVTQSGCVDTGRFNATAAGAIPGAPFNGFPAASYTVCVDYSGYGSTRYISRTVDTTNKPSGNTIAANETFNFASSSTGTSGACP